MMQKYLKTAARFFDRRFYFLAGGYAVFVITVIAAGAVLAGRGALAFVDRPLLEFVSAMQSDMLDSTMRAITAMGGGTVIVGLSIMGAAWFLYRGMTTHALALMTAVGGAAGVAVVMKRILERARPSGLQALGEHSFSFPSGHAALSLAFFGILVYFLLRQTHRLLLKIIAVAAGVAVVGAIGISRVYLGVHWPSDVVGSYVLVGVWLFIVIRHTERKRKEACIGRTTPE